MQCVENSSINKRLLVYELGHEIGKWKFWYREEISEIKCKAKEKFNPNINRDG